MTFLRIILCSVVFLVGCGVMPAADTTEGLLIRYTIERGVYRYTGAVPERAARVQSIVTLVRAQLEEEPSVTVALLQAKLEDEINWDSLIVPDQRLLRGVIDRVSESLTERLGEGVLDGDRRVALTEVLDWIALAAGDGPGLQRSSQDKLISLSTRGMASKCSEIELTASLYEKGVEAHNAADYKEALRYFDLVDKELVSCE